MEIRNQTDAKRWVASLPKAHTCGQIHDCGSDDCCAVCETGCFKDKGFAFHLTRRQAEIIIAEVAGVQCSCEHHAEMNRIATRLQAVLDAPTTQVPTPTEIVQHALEQ